MGVFIGDDIKIVYFIGIGGIHMSGLAKILKLEGYAVSGSDQKASGLTKMLVDSGVEVNIGHYADNLKGGIDLVVYTAAVKPDNPEFIAAKLRNIKMMDRAELLGLLMKNYKFPICISGTHGKTSTTSMISEIFMRAEFNPTIMNGGELSSIGGAMRYGGSKYFIAESCEYSDSFLKFFPYLGIILNVELDHTDYFGTIDDIRKSFHKFASLIPEEGLLIINSDVEKIEQITEGIKCRILTYGNANSDYYPENVVFNETGCASFDLVRKGQSVFRIELSVPGMHNVLNAVAAATAAIDFGIGCEEIAEGLFAFKGAKRRFQYKGDFNGAQVFDDYAHHPTEIKATIASAKNRKYNKLYCVFQPHTRSRTLKLLEDFSTCFDGADVIILLDIYMPAGREEDEYKIHSVDLAEMVFLRGKEVHYFKSFAEAEDYLRKKCINNDLLITMGAGDVYLLGESLLFGCQ